MTRQIPAELLRLQPNSWSCGPTALYNALVTMGVPCSLFGIIRASGIGRDTADTTPGLRVAASTVGVEFLSSHCRTETYFREEVRTRAPLLMCVDRDSNGPASHWIAVLRCNSLHVWIADSARPGPVLRRLTWRQFLARAVTVHGPRDHRYEYCPLVRRSTT